jgi:predicted TIM-barrel fold metal-dependent hydrolase
MLREQLLDKYNYWRGVLTHDLGEYGQHLNGYFGIELCRAANDWNIERWLTRDERLYSVIAVPTQAPEEAAKEIRRVGSHPKLVSVLLAGNGLGRPYGDPVYEPIHRAAADMGLSIAVHLAVNRPNSLIATVGGPVSTGIVSNSQLSQEAMHYATSFITHGVFEKYPGLKLMLKEFGISWLPSVIWGLDRRYNLLRFESPWVRRRPSEYFRNHIRLSNQPFEESPDPEAMIRLMETVDGVEEMLCFASDYPHISFDDPTYVARLLPARWHSKVFFDNACRVYGWDADAQGAAPGRSAEPVTA